MSGTGSQAGSSPGPKAKKARKTRVPSGEGQVPDGGGGQVPEADRAEAAATDAGAPKAKHKRHAAEVAHATHGRVRLKVAGAKDNIPLLTQIKAAFESQPGIDAVNIKPATGSLVIYYDPAHHPDIASLFARLGQADHPASLPVHAAPGRSGARTKLDEEINQIEEEAEFLAEHSELARTIVNSVKALDREIKRATNNNVDLKIIAPVGLAGFTFLEIGAAAATPMWVTLVIFSLNHFVELRAHAGAEARANGPVPAGGKG